MIKVTSYLNSPYTTNLVEQLIKEDEITRDGFNHIPSNMQESLILSLADESGCMLFVHQTKEDTDIEIRDVEGCACVWVNPTENETALKRTASQIYAVFKVLRGENAEGFELPIVNA